MQELGMITPVIEPIDWAPSHAYSWKSKRKLHACLDLQDLNIMIKWDCQLTPIIKMHMT